MTETTNLLIICGGQSPEHEVSLLSTKNVIKAVNREKFRIFLAGIDKGGEWCLYDPGNFLENPDDPNRIHLANPLERIALVSSDKQGYMVRIDNPADDKKVKIDVSFPVLHGANGEDGAVQGLLKMNNIAYVGCDILGSSVCMDKATTKKLLSASGIPVARGTVIYAHEQREINIPELIKEFGLPLFVKPANLGSSVGITKAKDREAFEKAIVNAFKFDSKILIEETITGREIECAVLGNETPRASVPGEIIPQHEFYSYEAKYIDADGALLEAPASLDSDTERMVRELAVKSYVSLGCLGMARVDFFLTADKKLLVNEINTIPGFTSISMYPRLWGLSGVDYSALIETLIELAIDRFQKEKALIS